MSYEERCAALGIARGALAEGFPEGAVPDRIAPKVSTFRESREKMRQRIGLGEGDMTALNPKTSARAKETGSMGGKVRKART